MILILCGEYIATQKEPGFFYKNPCMEKIAIEVSDQTVDLPNIKVTDGNKN